MFIRQSTTRSLFLLFGALQRKTHTHINFAGKHVPSSGPSNISTRLPLFLAELNPLRFVINVLSCVAQGGLGRAQRKPEYNLSNKKYDWNLRGFRKYATLEVLLSNPEATFEWKNLSWSLTLPKNCFGQEVSFPYQKK